MKNKRFYIFYTMGMLFIIFITANHIREIKHHISRTYKMIPGMYYIFFFLFFLGCLLGVEHLMFQSSKKGKWKLNLWKISIMGIPVLILNMCSWWILLGELLKIKIISSFLRFSRFLKIDSSTSIMHFLAVFLGWIVTTSFYKEKG